MERRSAVWSRNETTTGRQKKDAQREQTEEKTGKGGQDMGSNKTPGPKKPCSVAKLWCEKKKSLLYATHSKNPNSADRFHKIASNNPTTHTHTHAKTVDNTPAGAEKKAL